MSVFAVVLDEQNPKAVACIQKKYPNHHKLNDTFFLVTSNEITKKIADAVGIKAEGIQTGAVFRLNQSYHGYTSRALWEWMENAEQEK